MALGTNLKKQNILMDNPSGEIPVHSDKDGVQQKKQPEAMQSLIHDADDQPVKGEEDLMLIVFSVEKEEYALAIDMVSEVVKTPPIAPIPQVPDYIRGVANVRGNVVTILDLALRIGLSEDLSRLPNHLMVIKSEDYRIAVGVEHVPNTLMVKKTDIDHSSELMLHSALDEVYIKGIVKKDKRMIILIDILEMMKNDIFIE